MMGLIRTFQTPVVLAPVACIKSVNRKRPFSASSIRTNNCRSLHWSFLFRLISSLDCIKFPVKCQTHLSAFLAACLSGSCGGPAFDSIQNSAASRCHPFGSFFPARHSATVEFGTPKRVIFTIRHRFTNAFQVIRENFHQYTPSAIFNLQDIRSAYIQKPLPKHTSPPPMKTEYITPIITDQQVARSMKTSMKLLRQNPDFLEACRAHLAARATLKTLKKSIRDEKANAAK